MINWLDYQYLQGTPHNIQMVKLDYLTDNVDVGHAILYGKRLSICLTPPSVTLDGQMVVIGFCGCYSWLALPKEYSCHIANLPG